MFLVSCNLTEDSVINNVANVDLSKNTFDENTIYKLSGQWEFYWDTLLTPAQLERTLIEPELVEMPGTWSSYGRPSKGVATYRILLKLEPNNYYSLMLRKVFLAHKIWINGREYPQAGNVSKDMNLFVANDQPREYTFFAKSDQVEIVLQVANKDYRNGGTGKAIKIGTPKAIERRVSLQIEQEVFLVGTLLFVFLFLIFAIVFGKINTKDNFYFSLFLLTQCLTFLLDGEIILMQIFPHISWAVESKLWHITSVLRTTFLVLFISSITRKKFSKIIEKGAVIFSAIVFAAIVFSPERIYTNFYPIYIVFGLLGVFYSIFVISNSIKDDRNLYLPLVGLIVIFLTIFNDTFVDLGLYKAPFLIWVGVFIFVLLQLFYVSIRNTKLLHTDQKLVSNMDIQKAMNIALLSTNTFDIENSLETYVQVSNVDKVLIFYAKNDKFYLSHKIDRHLDYFKTKEEVDFSKDNKEFCSKDLQKAITERKSIYKKNKDIKKNPLKYYKTNKIKNIFIVPIIDNTELISLVYIEKSKISLSQEQEYVVRFSYNFLQNLIISTFLYTNLQELNNFLEKEIDKKKAEVKHQNEEIDHKNQELDEKIQFIEEQVTIQREITQDIKNQNVKLDQQQKNLEEKNRELETDKKNLETIKKSVDKNIKYAGNILEAAKVVEKNPPMSSHYYYDNPKGLIGGDFFWSKMLDGKFLFTLADSTGHGIPGALMSLIGVKLINTIITEKTSVGDSFTPADVLEELRKKVKAHLTDKSHVVKDGYDMAFCFYYSESQKLVASCANNSIIIVRNKKIIQIKADKMPVGAYIRETAFKNVEFQLEKGDNIYLFSDGFVDQYGEKTDTKFYMANFKQLLIEISEENPQTQLDILHKTFEDWKGNTKQIDDVSIAYFKL